MVKRTTTIVVVVVVGQEHCHPTWLLSNNYYFAPVPERHTMQMSTTAAAQFCWGGRGRERESSQQYSSASALMIFTTLTFRLGYPFWTFLLFSSSALLGFPPGDVEFFNRPKLFWQGNYDFGPIQKIFHGNYNFNVYIYMWRIFHEEDGQHLEFEKIQILKLSNRSKSPFKKKSSSR